MLLHLEDKDSCIRRVLPVLKVPPADLTAKVAIITGGNSGIGLHIARSIAKQDATVYLSCGNTSKAREEVSQITSENPLCEDRVRLLSIDMSLLSSVYAFAEKVNNIKTKIDLLFRNAGVMAPTCWKGIHLERFSDATHDELPRLVVFYLCSRARFCSRRKHGPIY